MASTDIPPFLRDKVKKDIQAKKSDIPPFLQKKSGGEDTLTDLEVGADGQLTQSVPATSQSFVSKPSDAFAILPKTPTVTTNDGISFPVSEVITTDLVSIKNTPESLQALQGRIANKTVTDQDVEVLAKSSGKSVDATKAYIQDGQLFGGSVENVENVNNAKTKLTNYINDFNTIYKTNYEPNDILSSSQKTFDFLETVKNKKALEANQANTNQPISESTRMPSQQNAISALLPTDISDEMINKVVGMTIEEDKKAGINKDETIIKIAKKLNPKEFAKVEKLQSQDKTLYDYTPTALLSKVFRNNTEQDELLNYQKGIAEVTYNQAFKQNSINKISEGVLSGNQELINEGQHDLSQVDEDAVYKYPSLVKQQIAQRVNDEIAKQSGVVVGSEVTEGNRLQRAFGSSTNDRLEVMKQLGYLDDPRTKDIAESMADNSTYFANNSIVGGAVSSFLQPFADLGMSVADILAIRNAKDIETDKIKDELFQQDFTQNTEEQLQLKKDVRIARTVVNTTFNLAGMLAIASATEGVAGTLGASASLGAKLGAYTSFGLPSFDASLKDSKNFLDSESAQYIYATINSIANAEGGRLLDLGKVTRIPGVSDDFAKLAKGLSDNTITEKAARELLDGAENKYVDFAVKYGKNVTKGAAVMAYFTTANNIIKLGFGDPNIESTDILPQAGHAFLDGVLGMSIMGGFGAVSDMRREKNTTYKGTIYNIALNHDAAKDVFDFGLKIGEYDKDAYDNKIAILNTAVAAKNALDAAQIETGVELTQDQKAVYVANKTAENVLRNKAKNTKNNDLKEKYELQADALSIQVTKTLDGLKFTRTLEPLYDLYDAEKEYNAALENYKPNDIASSDALEVAKKNYDILYSDYLKNNSQPSTILSKPTEKLKEEAVSIKPIESVAVSDNEMLPTLEKVKEVIPEEKLVATQDILTRVNNAENINEKEIETAQDELYSALDAAPEAAHLIEPLILKLQDYEFTTKTETSTVTETVPVEVPRPIVERKAVNKSISQWEGNRATITDANGKTIEGVVNLEDGKYYLKNENGEKVAALGDTAITDRDITLPSIETVPNPIQFDENGDIKSMTLQLNKLDTSQENGVLVPDKLITINFRDKEKALDYAIQLRAEQVGEFPQPEFDIVYEQIQREIQQEVPVKDISTPEKAPTENVTITQPEIIETKPNEVNTEADTKNKQVNVQTEAVKPTEEVVTETAQPTEKTKGKDIKLPPPEDTNITDKAEDDTIGITHAEISKTRKDLGLPEYGGKETETHEQLLETAQELIKGGYNLNKIFDKVKNSEPTSNVENAIMAEYKAALDVEMANNPTKKTLKKLSEFAQISDEAGTFLGKGLESRKILKKLSEADTLANFLVIRQKDKGHDLTDTQIKEQTAKFNELKKAKDELEVALRAEQEKNATLIAEQGLNKAKSIRRKEAKKTHEEYVQERKDAVAAAREALSKLRTGQSGLGVSIPGVRELVAIAPHVKKAVESLLNEGIDKLDNIVNTIHADFKDVLDGISKKDIMDIIGGIHDEKRATANEKNADLRLLKREAELLNTLQRERLGEEKAKSETQKSEKSRRITDLENKIKEVRKQKKERGIEDEPVRENTATDEQNKAAQKRLTKRIEKLQEDLKNKNYSPEPKKQDNLVYTRKTQLLKDKVINLENKITQERYNDERSKMSGWEKAWDKFQNVAGIRRVVQTALDASIWFRQLGSLAMNPRKWDIAKKFIVAGSRSVFSQTNYDRYMDAIHKAEDFKESLEDGIRYNELNAADPKNQNEFYPRSFLYKIPIVRNLLTASQRIADSSLNVARYELYNKYKERLLKQGITRESDPEMYKAMAKVVMNSTGSGNLLSALENRKAEKVMGALFYGARLMAANFNVLNPVYYAKLPKQVRAEAMKDLASYATTIMATGLAMAAAGGKISFNPDESGFLQVRFGDKVYDITGGKAAYIRTFLRLVEAGYSRATKTKYEAGKSTEFGAKSTLSFFRNKLSPNTSYAINAFTGKNSIGQDFDPYEVVKVYPMYADDAYKAAKEDGYVSLLTVVLPNIIGVGYGNYYSEPAMKPIEETLQRNMRSDEINKESIKNYNNDGAAITDKEFQTYIEKRDAAIEQGIKDLYEGTAPENNVLDENNEVVTKKYNKLSKEQIIAATTAIKRRATNEVKEELFGKKTETKEDKKAKKELSKARKEIIE